MKPEITVLGEASRVIEQVQEPNKLLGIPEGNQHTDPAYELDE
jgi:hypothetical protein